MNAARVNRIVVTVEDRAAAAADFAAALGIEFSERFDDSLGRPVAVSDIVTITGPATGGEITPVVETWRGPLAAVEFAVDDVAATASALGRLGIEPVGELGGATTFQPFHGLPIRLVSKQAAAQPAPDPGPRTRLDRAVLAVDDIEAAARDLAAVFGIELKVFDVENMGIRVGLGEEGIEFIGKMADEVQIEQYWNAPITGYAIQVADLDTARQRMADLGAAVTFEFTTPGGSIEVFYGKPGLHGVPITLIPYHEDGGLLESMGIDGESGDVSPTIAQ